MSASEPISKLLGRLWHQISPRRRWQFLLLLVLMILTSFAEIISIGAVFPFLAVFTAPDRIFSHPFAQPFIHGLRLSSADQLLLPLTIAFGAAAMIAAVMRIFLLWANTHISYATGADLSINIYRRTLYQPYVVHVARNSSEIINGISNKTVVVTDTIVMILNLIGSSVMLMAILITLLSVEPVIALAAFGGFGLIYASIIRLTRGRLMVASERMARESTQVIKSLQEGLGGIRDILIDGSQDTYCQIFRDSDLQMRQAQGSRFFISVSPRYAMEALGMVLIAALAYSLAQQSGGVAKAIPVLGVLALGAQRLLPVLQQAYTAWSTIRGSQASLRDALTLLDQPLPDYAGQPTAKPIEFFKEIKLSHLSFRYNDQTPWILKNLELVIPRGSRTGFIGVTGTGKSTLLDIVMGLLPATDGRLEIDGQLITSGNHRTWQAHIAHVPQAIFLTDATVEENIAFGVPTDRIDYERIHQSARQAQIADVIESWPEGYKTLVGERGVRLSGGQRQRIGIARALYKQADVIIFDEATSALDNETEIGVMRAIEGLSKDLTVLIIAHRLTTLKNCTQIVELAGGGIQRIGSYQDIVNQAA